MDCVTIAQDSAIGRSIRNARRAKPMDGGESQLHTTVHLDVP